MCVLSTFCGNVDKHSPFDIYIYIYIVTDSEIFNDFTLDKIVFLNFMSISFCW